LYPLRREKFTGNYISFHENFFFLYREHFLVGLTVKATGDEGDQGHIEGVLPLLEEEGGVEVKVIHAA